MGILHEYVKKNDLSMIKRLVIEKGVSFVVSNRDLSGNTMLLLSCALGLQDIFKYALEQKSDVNISNKAGDTPLILSVKRGDMSQVKRLIEIGADANKPNLHGNTPLHYAAFWRNLEMVKFLVDNEISSSSESSRSYVNILNKYQKSPVDLTSGETRAYLEDRLKVDESLKPISALINETTDDQSPNLYEWEIMASSVQILDKIFESRKSVVYKGVWQVRQIAVKLPLITRELSDKEIKVLRNEIKFLKEITHTNLAPILAACTLQPDICIVSDFTSSGDLESFLHNPDIEMSPAHAIKLAFDTLKGLVYLHEWSPPIAHGNIKSRNILLYSDSKICLTDYGFSKSVLNSSILNPEIIYEPEWMAPELLAGIDVENPDFDRRKSDVYSFGLLLFEIVTRQYLFEETNAMLLGLRIAQDFDRPVIPSYVPADLANVMQECWNPDPNKRPLMKNILTSLVSIKI